MAMTPKQKAYIKELEEKNEKLKKVIEEIGAANLKMAEGRDNARTALADLVAAAEELNKNIIELRCLILSYPSGEVWENFIKARDNLNAAVERAKAITEGEKR